MSCRRAVSLIVGGVCARCSTLRREQYRGGGGWGLCVAYVRPLTGSLTATVYLCRMCLCMCVGCPSLSVLCVSLCESGKNAMTS